MKTNNLDDLVEWITKNYNDPNSPIARRSAISGNLHLVLVNLSILEELKTIRALIEGVKK